MGIPLLKWRWSTPKHHQAEPGTCSVAMRYRDGGVPGMRVWSKVCVILYGYFTGNMICTDYRGNTYAVPASKVDSPVEAYYTVQTFLPYTKVMFNPDSS